MCMGAHKYRFLLLLWTFERHCLLNKDHGNQKYTYNCIFPGDFCNSLKIFSSILPLSFFKKAFETCIIIPNDSLMYVYSI